MTGTHGVTGSQGSADPPEAAAAARQAPDALQQGSPNADAHVREDHR